MAAQDPMQDVGIGIFAAFIEGIILQPTLYWKNASAQGLPFTTDPRVVYRGTSTSIFNECAMMGLQFGMTSAITKHLDEKADSGKTDTDFILLASAIGGGGGAAFIATPLELLMIQQQKYGGSVGSTLKRLHVTSNPSILFRGLSQSLCRDCIYVGAMLGLTPVLKRHFETGKLYTLS
jgi:hypothetical protein